MFEHPRDDMEFILESPRPKQTLGTILMRLTNVCFALTILLIIVVSYLIHAGIVAKPIYWVGVIFMLGCFTLLILLNLWLTERNFPKIAKVMMALLINSILILLPLSVVLLTLRLSDYKEFSTFQILLPIFIAQFILLLFLLFIIPGLVDEENGDKKLAFLIIAYFLSFIVAEICLQLAWNVIYVIALPLLTIVIHLILTLPGCCTSKEKLYSFWVSTFLIIAAYTLVATALFLNDRLESLQLLYFPMMGLSLILLIRSLFI